MLKMKFLVVAVVVMALLLVAAAVMAESITVNTTGTINTSQTMPTRLFRDGVPSDCGGKAYPGTFGSGTLGYTVEGPFGPVAQDSCITVTWDPMTCDVNGFVAAFLNGFDPTWAANAANYVGDAGSSLAGTFSFPVSAGDSFVLAFMNSSTLSDCTYSYSFTYEKLGGEGCTLSVPEGSVVGDAPFQTQVYYEPGNISPDVFLNPGTYIVVGQDESQTYYKIMLACQFVWVRKDTMQPSYAQPQNGAPLPTLIVG